MKEVNEFFHMGGYAAYIWSAYLITFVVLLANVLVTRAQFKKAQLQIARKTRQQKK